ncbi:hypothetical protein FP828_03670 [bacterium]|nr:hypothetical protein [bacterium]
MTHKLIIISLHDAQAECTCGHWRMIGTGERSKKEIRAEYRKHKKGESTMETNKTEVFKSAVGDRKGWAFSVGRNFVSALYKTQKEAKQKLKAYLGTGKFDWYGTAE